MNHKHHRISALLLVLVGSTATTLAAEMPVLLAQGRELSIGGFWSDGVATTITGMQFFISLDVPFTNASYANGTYSRIDETRLGQAVGGALTLSKGQTGVFDFPVTNGVRYSNVVAALTNGVSDFMDVGGFGYNVDRIVTGGTTWESQESGQWGLPNGQDLAGCRIDFFRLIVTTVDWGRTNGAFQINGTAQWQIFGATNQPCSPHRATATPTVVNGFLVGAVIIDAGCGYTNPPYVSIQGGSGSGASAIAIVAGGKVTAINVTDAGCCYTNAPTIVIGPPSFIPSLNIKVSKIKVEQNVMLGQTYVLESSSDLINWAGTGPPFTATSELIETEFDVGVVGKFFRIRQVP